METNRKDKGNIPKSTRVALYLLAFLVALIGLMRMVYSQQPDRYSEVTLLYFLCAGALLLLDRVKSISLGENKVEFETLREQIAEAKSDAQVAKVQAEETREAASAIAQADMTQNRTPAGLAANASAQGLPEIFSKNLPMDLESEDPWSGYFGGHPAASGNKILIAKVERLSLPGPLYKIRLEVRSTNPLVPLTGLVKFFLHPTFSDPFPVREASNGVAELELIAYGSWTVGAVCADGTELGLNLAKIPGVDEHFRNH
jgi:hypothetical protein